MSLALGLLLAGPLTAPVGAFLDNVCSDSFDLDDDFLSDKLECEMLHTDHRQRNTDGNGREDGVDLAPQVTGSTIDVLVSVAQLEAKDKCDVGSQWDPFISTGFINIQTLQGTPSAVFSKTGYTEGTHGHDKKNLEPGEAIQARIAIPQDLNVYVVPSIDSFPFFHLVFGLADHDINLDDEVRLSGSQATVDDATKLLIAGPGDSQKLSVTYEGGGSSCDGKIIATVDSPITYANLVAAVLKKANPGQVIDTRDVLNRMPGSERCTPDAGISSIDVGETCSATPDLLGDPLSDPADNSGTDVDGVQDASGYADTDDSEHTAWHYVSDSILDSASLGLLLGSFPGGWTPGAPDASARRVATINAWDSEGALLDRQSLALDLEALTERDGLSAIPPLDIPWGATVSRLSLEISGEDSRRVFDQEWAVQFAPDGSGDPALVYLELGEPGRNVSRLFSTWEDPNADGDFWDAMHERVNRHR